MSYTLVLEWMPGDLYMSAVTARCTAPTSSYSVVWLPPNKVYQITLYCGSTSLVSFLVGAFRGKAWSYMKKTVLVLITFALVIAVAGSGFWLVHYFIDSREQRQTYETLAEEFVLESTPSVRPESSSSLDSSVDAGENDVSSPVESPDTPPPARLGSPGSGKSRLRGVAYHPRHGNRLPCHAHTGYPGALSAPGFLR